MLERGVRHRGRWRRLLLLLLLLAPLFAGTVPAKAGGVIPGICFSVPCPVFDLQNLLKNSALKMAETVLNQLLQQITDLWGVVKNEVQVTPTPPTYEILESVKLPPFQLSDLPCFKQTSTATDPIAQDREDLTLSFVQPSNYHGTMAEEQQLAVCRQAAATVSEQQALAAAKAMQVHLKTLMKKQDDFMKKGCSSLVGAANDGTLYCLLAQRNQLMAYKSVVEKEQATIDRYRINIETLAAMSQTTNRNLQ